MYIILQKGGCKYMKEILTNFNTKTIFMQVKLKIVKNENR